MGSLRSIGSKEVQAGVARLAHAIRDVHGADSDLWIVGIANGGIALAQRISAALRGAGRHVRTGTVDVSFHRDDIGRHPIPKEFAPTILPGDVTGSTVVLVDDVLFTGRTAKAALDELFDHGRPARVALAVLVDRGGRRLPISADYVGLAVAADAEERVSVRLDLEQPERDAIRIAPARPQTA
ncbi:MAG: bifunctional pyr operon transcriptional regulator/uracil phosphoribosyltransferase PyrR [Opitutaceae bacterium]